MDPSPLFCCILKSMALLRKNFFGDRKQTALLSTGFVGRAPSSPINKTPAFAEGAKGQLNFPKDFLWGSSTSAHQVEGDNSNDWTVWEQRMANHQAQIAQKRQWPDYILKNYPSPLQEKNYISGKACDHYNRFREDFALAKSLGHNAHRFSIEWSRIEPEEGKFDQKEIEHYREVIKALRERGMEPLVTLWHWTLPLWVARKGGFENRETADFFVRYCEKIAGEFKDNVTFFITLSEPTLWASNAYRTGNFPPQKKNIFRAYRVVRNLIRAHRAVYKKLKTINPNFQVGITQNTGWFSSTILRPLYYSVMFYFLRNIMKESDFIGLDYYRRLRFLRKSHATSDIGWEIYSKGIYFVLKKTWRRFRKPIFILENGVADVRDIYRAEFIRAHITAIEKAGAEGVDIRGYFYWSLLDNFEWENGFWPRFGLVEVDYKTQQRKVRESAKVYADIIKISKP